MKTSIALWTCLAMTGSALAQGPPDMFHYMFNEGSGATTVNTASPGVGVSPAPVVGQTLVPAPAGQFMDGCLQGAGTGVDTGWIMAFGAGDWTISFWLDLTGSTSPTSLQYLFGEPVSLSFRCFTNGAAGAGNVVLRGGPLADAVVFGGASNSVAQVITYVHDSTVPEIRCYLDGVLVNTAPQTPWVLNGTTALRVGGQTSGLNAGTRMDEFRVWSLALSAAQVAALWSVPIGGSTQPLLTTVGTGCAGTAGLAPTLSSTQLPSIGNGSFSVDVLQAAPNSQAFLYLSLGMAPSPLSVGGGCMVYLEPVSLFQLIGVGFSPLGPVPTSATGATSFLLPIPPDPGLAGSSVGLQVAIGDPASPTGFTVTNALEAVIN